MRFNFIRSQAAKVLLTTLLLLLVLLPVAHAQGANPSVSSTMHTVKTVAVAILRLGMAVGTIIGLVKVTKNFLNGSPNAISSFFWLVGAVFVFFLWGSIFRDSFGTWSASAATTGTIGNSHLNAGVSTGAYMMGQKILDTMLTTVVPLLMFTTVALTVIRGLISNGTVQFEFGPIARVIFMYIMLVNYQNFVPLVGNLIGGLADQIQTNTASTSAYTVLKQLREADRQAKQQSGAPAPTPSQSGNQTQDQPGLLSGLAGDISEAVKTAALSFSPANILTGLATDFMTSIVQAIMEFIQSFLVAFLYVSGPIALSFSLLPGFGGLAKGWLQSLIGIHMWSIAFQVIAGLFIYYQSADAALQFATPGSTLATVTGIAHTKFVVGCIVFIIMYIMVPYMSSLIVGSSAADGFVGSAVRIATTIASGAATGGAGLVGAAGAGATAVNSLGAGASTMSQMGAFTSAASSHVGQSLGMGQGGSLQQIGQMFGGGGGGSNASAPIMSGAGNQTAAHSPIRSTTSDAAVPSQSTGTSQGSATGATQGFAQQAPAPAASDAPSMSGGSTAAQTIRPVAHAPSTSGGSTTGFGRARPVGPAVAAAPVAPIAGQAPPRLTGGRPARNRDEDES